MRIQKLFVAFLCVAILCIGFGIISVVSQTRLYSVSAELLKDKNRTTSLSSQLQSITTQYSALKSSLASKSTSPTVANSEAKAAYLTFDDGPSKLTPKLLDTLKANGVKATFFIIGINAQKTPDVLNQMIAYGDVIGVHSWTHEYSYIYSNTNNFFDDFNKLKIT